jgi:hypothetical protein
MVLDDLSEINKDIQKQLSKITKLPIEHRDSGPSEFVPPQFHILRVPRNLHKKIEPEDP